MTGSWAAVTGTRPAWGNGVFGPRSPLRYLPCAAGRRWWQIRPVRTSTTRWCGTKMEPTDVGRPGGRGGHRRLGQDLPDRAVLSAAGSRSLPRLTQPGHRSASEPVQGATRLRGGRRGRGVARDLDGAGSDGCSARPGAAGASSAGTCTASAGRDSDRIGLRSSKGRRPSGEPVAAGRGPTGRRTGAGRAGRAVSRLGEIIGLGGAATVVVLTSGPWTEDAVSRLVAAVPAVRAVSAAR